MGYNPSEISRLSQSLLALPKWLGLWVLTHLRFLGWATVLSTYSPTQLFYQADTCSCLIQVRGSPCPRKTSQQWNRIDYVEGLVCLQCIPSVRHIYPPAIKQRQWKILIMEVSMGKHIDQLLGFWLPRLITGGYYIYMCIYIHIHIIHIYIYHIYIYMVHIYIIYIYIVCIPLSRAINVLTLPISGGPGPGPPWQASSTFLKGRCAACRLGSNHQKWWNIKS